MYVLPIAFGTPAFDEALYLRHLVLRVPLGRTFHAADIAREWASVHLGTYAAGGQLLGVLTLLPLTAGRVKMRQVAVAESARRKGVGRQLVAASEEWATANGYAEMVLHAREVAVAFYDKLGYARVGERFMEVGIPHYKMCKHLPAGRRDL